MQNNITVTHWLKIFKYKNSNYIKITVKLYSTDLYIQNLIILKLKNNIKNNIKSNLTENNNRFFIPTLRDLILTEI